MRRGVLVAVAAVAALCLTGCSNYRGINSLSLPGDVGTASNSSYQVQVQLQNAANLVPNTPVLINDINVGTVTKVSLDGWTPTLTLSLLDSVHLPANAVAKLGQTSILGSKHIELSAPPDQPGQGRLAQGALIPVGSTHAYPETEDLLAGVSLLLNGGGLQSFQTITTEANKALGGGRAADVRDLLTQLNNFTGGLDAQRNDIVTALQGLDRFSGTLAPRMGQIDTALQTLPQGLQTLDDEEPALRDALDRLGRASDSIQPFSDGGSQQLRGVFHELEPALRQVADTQHGSLISALKMAPFLIFPLDWVPYLVRGDYANLVVTVDLTNEALDKAFLNGTPASGALTQGTKLLKGQVPDIAGLKAVDPLKLPGAAHTRGPVGLLRSDSGDSPDNDHGDAGAGVLPKALPGLGG